MAFKEAAVVTAREKSIRLHTSTGYRCPYSLTQFLTDFCKHPWVPRGPQKSMFMQHSPLDW